MFNTLDIVEKYPILLQPLNEETLFDITFLENFLIENRKELFEKMEFEDFEFLIHYHILLTEQCLLYDEEIDDFPEILAIYLDEIDIIDIEINDGLEETDEVSLQQKRNNLKEAIKKENYEEAAELAKEIKLLEIKIKTK